MKATEIPILLTMIISFAGLAVVPSTHAQTVKKPNILVIWGNDIGETNVSAYSHGVMGYKTPNIDCIAREGALFTDCYGEQSCSTWRKL